MKQTILFAAFLLGCRAAQAQAPAGYTAGGSAGNVDCYYAITQCNGKTVVLLRFDNKNAAAVHLSWKEAFNTVEFPQTSPGLRTKQVTLAPGLSPAVNCQNNTQPELMIGEGDVTPTYIAHITGFGFTNLNVVPVQ